MLQGLLWILITPPLQAPDEPAHLAYVQHICEDDDLAPRSKDGNYSRELAGAFDYLKVKRLSHSPHSPYSFTAEEAEETQRKMEAMTQADRSEPSDLMNTAGFYPPLYYYTVSVGYRLFGKGTIVERLYGTRLASVLLSSLTVLMAYFMARILFGGDTLSARTAACLVLFHPMFAFVGASVNCDTMTIFIAAVMLCFCLLTIRDGPSLKNQLAISVCIAAGLLTKPIFGAMVSVWFVALVIAVLNHGLKNTRTRIGTAVFPITLITAGILYWNYGREHLVFWETAIQLNGEDGSILRYMGKGLLMLPWPLTLVGKRLLTSYWANFGWMDTVFPFNAIYIAAHILMMGAHVFVIYRIVRSRNHWYKGANALVSFALLGFFVYYLCILVMGFTIAHAGNLQGRYLFSTLALNMIVFTTAFVHFNRSEAWRRGFAYLFVTVMAVWHIASYALVYGRYYL